MPMTDRCEKCGRVSVPSTEARIYSGPSNECPGIDYASCQVAAPHYQRGRAEAMAWRRMETAPKSGVPILVATKAGVMLLFWTPLPYGRGGWKRPGVDESSSTIEDLGATHWTHRPPPPGGEA
jgi:hypothetical protein